MQKLNIKNLISKVSSERPYWIPQLNDIEKFNEIFNDWASNNEVNQLLMYEQYGFSLDDVESIIYDYFEQEEEFLNNTSIYDDEDFDVDEYCELFVECFFDDEWEELHPKHTEKYLMQSVKKIIHSLRCIVHQLRVSEKIEIVLAETWGYIGQDIRDVNAEDLDPEIVELVTGKEMIDNIDEYADWNCQLFMNMLRGY